MPVPAHDSTLPPLSSSLARLCPRCRAAAPAGAGWDSKCPEHELAYVDARALAESGQDTLLGTTLAGRFVILARIGSGSMGAVYRARQVTVGRDVALKIVRRDRAYDPETKARFEREARAVSLLKSPHTVTAFDFGEAEDGSWFLALEMLEGETLGDRLRRERRLYWVDALRFASDALRSLAEAHAQGIIHRDLKPDNLFLACVHDPSGDREICKILDFGIAKWVREEEAPVDQLETLAGTVFGTPRYMSPEQAQGAALDPRSDLYSLGVLLFQMLAGRAPFVDDDAVVVMARHIKNAPPELSEAAPGVEIPPAVEAVVRRALEKLPENRPASAEQMLNELEHALASSRAAESGVRPLIAEDDLPESLRLAKRRTWLLAGLLAVSLVAIVALGLTVWGAPLKRWSEASGTGAQLKRDPEPSHAASVTTALQPAAPTPAPITDSASRLENSASIAPASASVSETNASARDPLMPAPSAGQPLHAERPSPTPANTPSGSPGKKPATKTAPSTPLERRGNERYGRFD
ncbi:MAG TPA: serine/threonine-protein kinase [Polyangiaceae bacterium]|nr:serine/threonine-protein kinase [Polyangiaceae bacterium]